MNEDEIRDAWERRRRQEIRDARPLTDEDRYFNGWDDVDDLEPPSPPIAALLDDPERIYLA